MGGHCPTNILSKLGKREREEENKIEKLKEKETKRDKKGRRRKKRKRHDLFILSKFAFVRPNSVLITKLGKAFPQC